MYQAESGMVDVRDWWETDVTKAEAVDTKQEPEKNMARREIDTRGR